MRPRSLRKRLMSAYVVFAMVVGGFGGLLVFEGVVEEAKAATLTVGPGQTYTTIGTAITAANPGDIIRVYAGTYNENIVINKALTLIGNGTQDTKIDGGGTGDVVYITSNWVNVSGLTIFNSGNQWTNYDSGIHINHKDNITIENCNVTDNNLMGIYIDSSNFTIIRNNSCFNQQYGVFLRESHNTSLLNNNLIDNWAFGMYLLDVYNCSARDNNCSNNNLYGILIDNSHNNEILNNSRVSNNYCGIRLEDSLHNIIRENKVIRNQRAGIFLESSPFNCIKNNSVINNTWAGIELYHTQSIELYSNTFTSCGIYINSSWLPGWNTHKIALNNTVNGNPIRYYYNTTGGTVPSGAGQIIIANCTNMSITGQNCSYTDSGIQLGFSNGNEVRENNCSNCYQGIRLSYSSLNNVSNNTCCFDNIGIFITSTPEKKSLNNTIRNNSCCFNSLSGIFAESYSSGIEIVNNDCSYGNYYGIGLSGPQECSIRNNICLYNKVGISIQYSNNNIVDHNIASNNEWGGFYLAHSDQSILHNNTGENNILYGILLTQAENNLLKHNSFNRNNETGIWIGFTCRGNYVVNNTMIENRDYGIDVTAWLGTNTIFHNDFINNTQQAIDRNSNTWDNGNGEGNYWSDYSGIDNGAGGRTAGDGIGDTNIPHLGLDNYPMMEPCNTPPSLPPITFVDDDFTSLTTGWGYDHFEIIQDGINGVAENGYVYVYNGIYYENVLLNKTVTIIGNGTENSIIDGNGNESAVNISVDDVDFSMFGIHNANIGIALNNASNTTIGNCKISNCSKGIELRSVVNGTGPITQETDVYPDQKMYWSGRMASPSIINDGWLRIYSTTGRSWIKFNLSSIPDDATINEAILKIWVFDANGAIPFVNEVTVDPVTAPLSTLYADLASSPTYAQFIGPTSWGMPVGWKEVSLNSTGRTAIENCLGQDWIAFGLAMDQTLPWSDAHGCYGPNFPTLTLNYTINNFPTDLCSNNYIHDNIIENNSFVGIYLNSSQDNVIENNTCASNGGHGISLNSSDNNILTGNSIINNTGDGIHLQDSDGNDIYGLSSDLDDGLVGHWKMDEASWSGTSGEVMDSSGAGNHGTAIGGVTTTNGRIGNAGDFDGTNDYIDCGNDTSLNPTSEE